MMLGSDDAPSGNAVIAPQDFGDEPGALYGTDSYSLTGTATQESPHHNAEVKSATMLADSAILSSGRKLAASKITLARAAKVEKPKKKNKVLGFL